MAQNSENVCEGGKRSQAGGTRRIWNSRRERGKERPMVTRPRETESAPAYNLKTHSAFKLLTMAAGYKVLCRYHGEREARRDRGGWRRDERDSKVWFIWEEITDGTTARRRADRGQILDGEYDKKKDRRTEVYFAAGISAPSHVWHFSSGMPASRFSSFRSSAIRQEVIA